MDLTTTQIWTIIVLLGVGTLLIRFSFLGLIGDRELPEWVLRHLRYTPVAVLPGLVAPLIVWPDGRSSGLDPVALAAAGVALAVSYWRKNVVWGVVAGGVVVWTLRSIGI